MERKSGYGFLIKWFLMIIDLFIINLTFYLVCLLIPTVYSQDFFLHLRLSYLLLNTCYFLSITIVPLKIQDAILHIDKVVQRSLSVISLHLLLFVTSLIFLNFQPSIIFLGVFYFILFVVFSAWRICARLVIKKYRDKGHNYKNVIIIGADKVGIELYKKLKTSTDYGLKVIGIFDDNTLFKDTLSNYLGKISDLDKYLSENPVDELYYTLPVSEKNTLFEALNATEKHLVIFYIVPGFYSYLKKRMSLNYIDSIPIMRFKPEPLEYAHHRLFKRIFDIIVSSIFLTTIYPITHFIIGLFIKVSSPGPVIFKQLRTGLYGNDFYCYKFRSMRMNDDADKIQAKKDDPRKTKVGEFLRKYNLDEFPQFYNVLKGDMSIVGPRPHMLLHTEMYSQMIDQYMIRHLVKPGITGWAQVTGCRGETQTVEEMEERIKRDVWYIENCSFLLDLKILFLTVFNMFKGEKKAY